MIDAPITHHTKDSDWETVAQRIDDSKLMRTFKSVFWGMDLESYTRQVAKALPFE
jgi:hypothetical protein